MADTVVSDVSPRRLPPTWLGLVLTAVLVAGSGWFFLHQAQSWSVAGLDSGIYRGAAKAFLAGEDVYSGKFGGPGLPFTYPPFALVVFVPLVLVPESVANLVMFVASTAALIVCVRWCQAYAGAGRAGPWWTTVALAAAGSVAVEPLRTTLGLGQVNLLLLALVLGLDARGGRLTGVGSGLATAIKITPGLLVAAQAVRGDLRAFGRGVLAFAAATGLAAVLAPAPTRRYFTGLLWDSARPGNLDYVGNQSLRGLWERHLHTSSGVAWLLSTILVVGLGAWVVRRHRRDAFLSLTAAAVAGLLISPVSWSHHWVWVLPCVAVGARRGWRSPVGLASVLLLAMTVVELVLWPTSALPLLGQDIYVAAGLVWLLAAAVAEVGTDRAREAPPAAMAEVPGG